jgi:hypothetical protein
MQLNDLAAVPAARYFSKDFGIPSLSGSARCHPKAVNWPVSESEGFE